MENKVAMESIRNELKTLIIESLDLEEIEVSDIGDETTLFGEGVGLDSIDALELGMAISRKWGVTLSQNSDENRSHFKNVSTLAAFIHSKLN